MSDRISAPEHYTFSDIEPKDAIWAWQLDFYLGNVVKYIARAGRKAGVSKVEDLQKARQYIDFEIEKLNEGAQKIPQMKTQRRGVFFTDGSRDAVTASDLRESYEVDDGR